MPALEAAFLYIIMQGSVRIELEGEAPLIANSGDIVVVTESRVHTLRSGPDVPAPSFTTLLPPDAELWSPGKRMTGPYTVATGGGGATTRFMAVLLEFSQNDSYLLRLNLPPQISINGEAKRPWRSAAIETIAMDAEGNPQGYLALATRLAELLFIDAIRTHLIAHRDLTPGWLRASADPRLARALSAMHGGPERQWRVAELAEVAGMSRSSFTQHFSEKVGEAPLAYLTRWRMSIAREWLIEGRTSVKGAAERMGYLSDKAFSQAFRRAFGHPPSSFRPKRAM